MTVCYLRSMTDKKAIAEKLLQINAIKLSIHQPFTWASGWKSPIYCDNRKILSFPFVRDYIKSELCNVIFREFEHADMIAGVATGAIAWGALAADQLKLPFIYVRPQPKGHGLGNQVEGYFEQGSRVVVVEDLVSTGKSSLEAVEALKKEGLQIEGMVSIFNYGFEEAKTAIAKYDFPYWCLTDYETLISLSIERGAVSPEDQNALLNWRSDPANWKGIV